MKQHGGISEPHKVLSKFMLSNLDSFIQTDCGNGIIAYGRRRRDTATNAKLYEEMPLYTLLAVYSPKLIPSSLLSASETNGKILIGVEGKCEPGCGLEYFSVKYV